MLSPVEGLGYARLVLHGPSADPVVSTWQSAVDLLGALPAPTTAGYVTVAFDGGELVRIETNLQGAVVEGLEREEAPDLATWYPVLGPVLTGLADLAAASGPDVRMSLRSW